MPFVKGQSGNPAGRPIGSRNRKSLQMEEKLEGEADGLVGRLIEKAYLGDPTSMRLCIERIMPRGRERPIVFALPAMETVSDCRAAVIEINSAVAAGTINERESMEMLRRVEKTQQIFAAIDTAEAAVAAAKAGNEKKTVIYRWITPEEAIAQGMDPKEVGARRAKNNDNGNNENTMVQPEPAAQPRSRHADRPAPAPGTSPPRDGSEILDHYRPRDVVFPQHPEPEDEDAFVPAPPDPNRSPWTA